MIFLYGTDFHGSIQKYEAILHFAIEEDIKLIHLGADLLPKGSNMYEIQKKFVNGYLKEFYQRAKDNGIDILAFFGNDDIWSRKKYFLKYASLLDEVPYQKDGYEFKAYPYVPDYPFGLKTAVKLDSTGWKCPEAYLTAPVDFTDKGIVPILDINDYFLKKGTIEEDLRGVPVDNKTIMAIHCPPCSVDLDVCYHGRRVGSKAIYDWIEKNSLKLVLCGHIHESPWVSKVWKAKVGNNLVIQPGQSEDRTTFVVIDIQDSIDTHFITI